MAAELEKLANGLRRQGFFIGADFLDRTRKNLRSQEIIPEALGTGLSNAETFGGKVKDYRTRMRISQRQLAQRVGIDHSSISRIEDDFHEPSFTSASKIMIGLRLDPEQVLDMITLFDPTKLQSK